MKIVAGKTSPAELTTEDGTVIVEGTYTRCAQAAEAILADLSGHRGATNNTEDALRQSKEMAGKQRCALDAICAALGAENSQHALRIISQWRSPAEAVRSTGASVLAGSSPYSGPSNSCDARPPQPPEAE